MCRAIPLSILALVAAWPSAAQSTGAPSFEVADIKPSAGRELGPGKERILPGGRIEIPHATLKELMIGAYGVQANMIAGGPAWLDNDRFDIVAKTPDPNASVPTILRMLRTLLEDRFHLVVHREEREMPAYTLSVAKGASKLRPAADPSTRQSCNSRIPGPEGAGAGIVRRECRNITMAELARQFGMGSYGVDRQVVDATGLTGAFDLEFDFAPPRRARGGDAAGPADAPSGPTIFEGLAAIGLRLEPGKRALSVVVVDSARKPDE